MESRSKLTSQCLSFSSFPEARGYDVKSTVTSHAPWRGQWENRETWSVASRREERGGGQRSPGDFSLALVGLLL